MRQVDRFEEEVVAVLVFFGCDCGDYVFAYLVIGGGGIHGVCILCVSCVSCAIVFTILFTIVLLCRRYCYRRYYYRLVTRDWFISIFIPTYQ